MGEKPLMPWIIVEPSGKVLSAHCDCMVGLQWVSVAHMLHCFYGLLNLWCALETPCQAFWVIPSGVEEVQCAPVKCNYFIGKKKSLATVESSNFGPANTPSPSPSSSTPETSKSLTPAFEDLTHEETEPL